MKARKQDALALVRKFGKPDFFITFTCNPHWIEYTRDAPPGVPIEHRPELCNRVFSLKLRELMKDLTERHILGKVIAHTYVIEFQKRGLPHAHILLIMDPRDGVKKENVGHAVQAVIPPTPPPRVHGVPETLQQRKYRLILSNMVHKNCWNTPNAVCHDKDGKCTKGFPKALRLVPDLDHPSGYPNYARPWRENVPDRIWNNQWVVPYNTYLLLKYEAHINVEACTSAKPVSYLYKYIFKGSDHADISVEVTTAVNEPVRRVNHEPVHCNDNDRAVDEVKIYHDARWVGSCEAAWRIMGLKTGEIKPPVGRLQVHLEHQQRILIDPEGAMDLETLQNNEKLRQTTLTEYFKVNKLAKEAAEEGRPPPFEEDGIVAHPRRHLYHDIPTYFTWNRKLKKWKVRQKGICVGRMYFMGVKAGEVFYLRLLLANVRGATSFEHLRTVEVQIEGAEEGQMEWRLMETYKDACVALKLTENDGEWHAAMTEASQWSTGRDIRCLMVTILLECAPVQPLALWNAHIAA